MEGFDELVIDSETSTPIHDNHFFKYRSLSNLRYFLDILVNKRLYMATYSELNDPWKGLISLVTINLVRIISGYNFCVVQRTIGVFVPFRRTIIMF